MNMCFDLWTTHEQWLPCFLATEHCCNIHTSLVWLLLLLLQFLSSRSSTITLLMNLPKLVLPSISVLHVLRMKWSNNCSTNMYAKQKIILIKFQQVGLKSEVLTFIKDQKVILLQFWYEKSCCLAYLYVSWSMWS